MKKLITISALFLAFMPLAWSQTQFEWPIKELDTAREVKYLSDDEKNLILELNKVRYNPQKYAEERMKELGNYYEGKFLKIPGTTDLETVEGKTAFDDCMEYLKTVKPAPILHPSKGMSKACQLLVYDQESTGETGHKGSGNTTPIDRSKKFGTFMGNYAENIHYGDCDAAFSVIELLIDDGVKSRGHRLNIMNPSFNYAGTAIGTHKIYTKMFVSTFASNFTEK